jgi:hypothetical protein
VWDSHGEAMRFPDDSMGWIERVTYARSFNKTGQPLGTIAITTTSGDPVSIDLANYRGSDPGAVWAQVGGRRVVHVRNGLATGTLDIYSWSERPGINVSVIGDGDVTDAEVRLVVEHARLR